MIDCPDRKGLVARVSGLLYEHGANILHADQHQDHELRLFFMRVEWSLGLPAGKDDSAEGKFNGQFDVEAFKADFAPVAAELGMRWTLTASARKPRVALFCSQYLHCVADLLYRWRAGELDCEISLIVSNHPEVELMAAFYGILFAHIPVTPQRERKVNRSNSNCLRSTMWTLLCWHATCKSCQPISLLIIRAAIINVHHSFLPAFTGARPYHAAHARGVKLIGATSHYVTEVLDDGPIIEQDVARISHRDQVEDLVARGRDLERMVLSRAVRWHLNRRILCYGNKTVIFD